MGDIDQGRKALGDLNICYYLCSIKVNKHAG